MPDRIAAAWPGNDYEALQVTGCETGWTYNPTIHNPSGKYHGLWQFSLSTWNNRFGIHDPHNATVEQQTLGAWEEYSARGWAPWPNCGKARFGAR